MTGNGTKVFLILVCAVILVSSTMIGNYGTGAINNVDSPGDSFGEPSSRVVPSKNARAEWGTEIIELTQASAIGITSGDFLKSNTGKELVALTWNSNAGKSELILLYRTESGDYTTTKIFELSAEISGIASGNIDATTAEDELVIITKESAGGKVLRLQPPATGTIWTSTTLKESDKAYTDIAVGDLAGTVAGAEIITVDADEVVDLMLTSETMDSVGLLADADISGSIIDIMISDLTPSEPGNQLLVIDDGGNIYTTRISGTTGNFKVETDKLLDSSAASGLTAMTVGDADNDGKPEVLVGSDDYKLIMIDNTGTSWTQKTVFTDTEPVYGIAVTDIDPFKTGFETVCAGGSKRLIALYHTAGAWSQRILYSDSNDIVCLLAGMLDDSNVATNEVATINGDGGSLSITEYSGYYSEVLVSAENKMSGVGIGDLDPDHPGNEAIVVGMDYLERGIVYMAWRDGDTWKSETLFDGLGKFTTGELLTPVVGNYDGKSGNELAVVGMLVGAEGEGNGSVTMIKKTGTEWYKEMIIDNPRFLHGAAIGNLLAENPGDELVVTSFTDKGVANVTVLTNRSAAEGGGWNATVVWQSIGHVRKAMFADIDPTHPGDELFVVDKSGNLTMIYQQGSGFFSKHLWTDPGTPGLSRLTIGDADNDGELEILVGGDSNNVGFVERKPSGEWVGKVIFTDVDKIRGVAVGDLDPNHPGNEVASYGYSARLNMLTPDKNKPGEWKARLLFKDVARGHDLAVGEFDSQHDGVELLMSGFSKNMTMVAQYDDITQPDFGISADKQIKTIPAGDSVSFNITVTSAGGFNEPVYLELESPVEGISLSGFESQTVKGSGTARLTLDVDDSFTPSTINLKLNAYGAGMSKALTLSLEVKEGMSYINVVSVSPEDGAHDVSTDDLEIEVEFDGTLNSSTLTDENILISVDGKKYKGTMALSNDKRTVIITDIHPENDEHGKLPNNATVSITIGSGLKTLDGAMLKGDYNWDFTTAEAEGHEDAGEMEGLYLSLVIIIIIVFLIAIVGVIYGKRQNKNEKEQEVEKEERKKPGKKV